MSRNRSFPDFLQTVDYNAESRDVPDVLEGSSPRKHTAPTQQDDSDTDFDEKATSEVEEEEDSGNEEVNVEELQSRGRKRKSRSRYTSQVSPTQGKFLFFLQRVLDTCADLSRPCVQTREVVSFTCGQPIN